MKVFRFPVVIGLDHLMVMMLMDVAFTQQDMSRVGLDEFLRQVLMRLSIMEELKIYTNSHFMVANLLIMSY